MFGRVTRKTLIVIGVLIVLIIAIRIALPYIIKDLVNKELDSIPGYSGHIVDVDLSIIRGAYQIEGVELVKTDGDNEVPFFSSPLLDFSVEWKALFEGSLVGEIAIYDPKLNFVTGPSEEKSQTSIDKSWQETVRDLFPLRINRFEVINGEIHYRDFHSDPKVDIFIEKLNILATNLTNSEDLSQTLVANLRASGVAMQSGSLEVNCKIDPYAQKPTFDLDLSIAGLQLTKLNNFLKAYGNFDVQGGTFGLYGEFAASEGNFEGYIKPLFKDLRVITWKEDHKNVFEFAWEAVVGLVAEIFENQPKDQVATRVPVKGSFENPEPDVWSTIGELIKNAFIEALLPGIEQRINLKGVKE